MPPKIDVNWDFILDNIKEDGTIICLGAELFSNGVGRLDQQLRQLIEELPDVRCYDDGLFNFKNSSDLFSHHRIKKFYHQDFPEVSDILQKIAQIPFSTIVSLNPDEQLNRAFEKQGFGYKFAYHHPKTSAIELPKPTCDEPLIYNLLGNIDVRESMVLTHEDLFEFLESAVEGKSISSAVKAKIRAATNFIFIGLPFDKWHTQLLLRVLQKDVNKRALKFAANQAKDQKIEMLCQDEFNIICVPTNIADFINELHTRCTTAGLIRAVTSQPTSHFATWKNWLKQDKLREILDAASDYCEKKSPPDTNDINYLMNLSGRLSNLDRKIGAGSISNDNALVERAQIRDAIGSFLDEKVRSGV